MQQHEVVVGHRRGVRWVGVSRGLYRRTGQEPLDARHADLLAWQVVLPRSACFTHLTAAGILGLWLPPVPAGTPVHVCLPKGENRPRRRELRVSRLSGPVRPLRASGLRVAPAAEALLACARDLGLLDLVVMLDSALRYGWCTPQEVEQVAGPRRRGAPVLRKALAHADPRAESPWESLLRMFHVLCEVPVVPQRKVYDEQGLFVARGDLWLRGTRTIHEYDGAVHRDRRTHVQDLARERALANAGWTRRGYTAGDLLVRPGAMLREADAAIDRPHDPGRLRPWRRALERSLFSQEGRAAFACRCGPTS